MAQRGSIARTEGRLQSVLENVTEGVVTCDMERNLVHWNRAALTMHDLNGPEARRHLAEFQSVFRLSRLDGSLIPLEEWPLSRILRGEELRGLEVCGERLDREWSRVLRYGGSLVRSASGEPVMAVVTIGDITDRKQTEEALVWSAPATAPR